MITVNIHESAECEQRVPRYTSYPTAVHFHSGVNASHHEAWLAKIPVGSPVSLYLHIPFCKQLCWFCGCHTKAIHCYEPVKEYIALLCKEISLVAEKTNHISVSHIHFGGGSPTLINASDFLHIMAMLRSSFSVCNHADIAVEADPRTLSESNIASYKKAGVNRVSIGIQDVNPKVQEAINRYQPFGLAYRSVQMLRDYGIHHLNFDLIYGLPYQTINSLQETLELTLTLKPDRIALFGYAHVPWMKKHQRLIEEKTLPNLHTRMAMVEGAKTILKQHGYIPIGIDHYAKKGDLLLHAYNTHTLRRNFQGYTNDNTEYLIGLGVSSISSFPWGYVQNTPDLSSYTKCVKAGILPVARGITIMEEDHPRKEIIESLLCYLKVDLAHIEKKYHLPSQSFSEELHRLKTFFEQGVLALDKNTLVVKESGRALLRLITSVFDSYLHPKERHSVAV